MRGLNSFLTRGGAAALSFVLLLVTTAALAQDGVSGGALLRQRNLSDVPNKAAARSNLGVTVGNIDYLAPWTSAQTRTVASRLADERSLFDFMTAAQIVSVMA